MSANKRQPTIIDDLDAGEEALSLSRALHLRELKVQGRTHNITWIHRAAMRGCRGADGKRVVLETTVLFGKKVTTRSAVLRFIRRQAGGSPQVGHEHASATAALARAGI